MLILALAIICIFSIRSCQLKSFEVTNVGFSLQMYQAQASKFSMELDKRGNIINEQEVHIAIRSKELEKALLANSKLKRLNTQIVTTNAITVRNVSADFIYTPDIASARVVRDSSNAAVCCDSCIYTGTKFLKTARWYTIAGTIRTNGVKFDSLQFRDSTTYNLGEKRVNGVKGFFKPKVPTLEVIHYNPYSNTTRLNNVTLVSEKKWFQTPLAHFLGGVVVGSLTNTAIGIGANRIGK